jgi:hypothetical protein
MTPNPQILKSIEKLNYRVTVGDVAANSGLNIDLARQGLLELASNANGHLQVSDTGEVVFLFPSNFQAVLRNKFFRLRLQEWWQKVGKILFYLIRISFGILLIASIILMMVAIAIIVITLSKGDNNNNSSRGRSSGPNLIFFPRFFYFPDLFWLFNYNYSPRSRPRNTQSQDGKMNFLEAIFSFIFGDGDPNYNLEDRRWNTIGTVISNHGSAVIAEQIAPYLDEVETKDNEDYMLPVLTRFNGFPEVSSEGDIIYYFPDLQVTANKRKNQNIASHLIEYPWRFSEADSGQIMLAIGLGALNIILALVLGSLLTEEVVLELGGLIAFVDSIYWLLLGYGTAFLAIPLIRYFWVQSVNKKIEHRNLQRQDRSSKIKQLSQSLAKKIDFARKFALEKVIGNKDLTYTTESDLLDQELSNSDKIDEEWRRRLESN